MLSMVVAPFSSDGAEICYTSGFADAVMDSPTATCCYRSSVVHELTPPDAWH